MLLQTTCSSVEKNPPPALRLEASSRPGDRGYCVQQDKPRQDCLLSQTNSLQWTSRPSDLKIPERHRSGGAPAGAQPGETYRQPVQQRSSQDRRYQRVPGQLQHLTTHHSPPPPPDCCRSRVCRPPRKYKYQFCHSFVIQSSLSHRDVLTMTQPSVCVSANIPRNTSTFQPHN